MKSNLIKSSLLLLIGFVIGITVFRCANNTGIGSDGFDPANYYTKDEIESLISKNKSSIIVGLASVSVGETRYAIFYKNGSEKECRIVAPTNGILRNLYTIQSSGVFQADSAIEVTVRVNGEDTPLFLTYTDTDVDLPKGNTSDSVNVNEGDIISLKFRSTGTNNPGSLYVSFLFDAYI
jgi:hypothetical protein